MLLLLDYVHWLLIYAIAMMTSTLWCFEAVYTTEMANWSDDSHELFILPSLPSTNETPPPTSNTNANANNNGSAIAGVNNDAQPFFENNTQRALIAAVGRTASLHCRVRSLDDRAVSWIRKRDLHILTIGVMTYTNDQRFQAQHSDESDEWVLKIVSVQPRDSGIYECQVSTEPKISQAYRLTVVVAKAKILASPELFFKSGSDINLTCVAHQAPTPPSYIYWYKDGELINYSQRGGINVLTERLTKTSKLLIARVLPSDSGNYTCTPSNSNSDSVLVHVIKSEHPAAMQHENAASLQLAKWLLALSISLALMAGSSDSLFLSDRR